MFWRFVLVQAGIGFYLTDWITLLFVVQLMPSSAFSRVILPEERYVSRKVVR